MLGHPLGHRFALRQPPAANGRQAIVPKLTDDYGLLSGVRTP